MSRKIDMLTEIIITRQEHLKNLHLLSNAVRSVFKNCFNCFRFSSPHESDNVLEFLSELLNWHFILSFKEDCSTLEELSTLLALIEAILSSHHLTSISIDPNDYEIFTAVRFWVGDSLMALEETQFTPTPIICFTHREQSQKMNPHLWN
ncbi:hypothetical protein HHI36_008099 [Cryptolaemus montrouzieri]|uniref:Uncharacterized protein n=1 Tax=Cryptolaemus montrouzieri TaxID=559131 RepID=A0ABD2MS16_9CUCU